MKDIERDKAIAIEVLRGSSIEKAAIKYGVTRERGGQLIKRIISLVSDPSEIEYKREGGQHKKWKGEKQPIQILRENADSLIERISKL